MSKTLSGHPALPAPAPRDRLLATPALERQLAARRARAGRAEQRRCQLAVAQWARSAAALTVAVAQRSVHAAVMPGAPTAPRVLHA